MRRVPVFKRFSTVLAGDFGHRRILVGASITLIAALCLLLAQGSGPHSARCVGGPVTVIAESLADTNTACIGAERAIAYLDGFGLSLERPIVIEVVDEIEMPNGAAALGTYDPRTQMVHVLARTAYSLGSVDDQVLGLPFDEELYTSVFSHEVTHAVLHQYEREIPLSPAAHEYVAYAVQLMTLSRPHRRRIVERFDGVPFTDVNQVSTMILAFDPNKFAVKSYLHFRDAGDQHAVLQNLIRASRAASAGWY